MIEAQCAVTREAFQEFMRRHSNDREVMSMAMAVAFFGSITKQQLDTLYGQVFRDKHDDHPPLPLPDGIRKNLEAISSSFNNGETVQFAGNERMRLEIFSGAADLPGSLQKFIELTAHIYGNLPPEALPTINGSPVNFWDQYNCLWQGTYFTSVLPHIEHGKGLATSVRLIQALSIGISKI